ncbi:hypothetical protein A9Q74_09895 [Colwellia sp. 39_35_sub15_T18]|nr:hypothetical protein A9Q74_09895 [Colwellia sp. 39_35_sub15_T18]
MKTSILVITSTILAGCGEQDNSWGQQGYTDKFTDQKYMQYSSEKVNGVYITLGCAKDFNKKGYRTDIVFHNKIITYNYSTVIKIRVDEQKPIEMRVWMKLLDSTGSSDGVGKMKWQHTDQDKAMRLVDDLKSGKYALVNIDDKSVRLSLTGFNWAYKSMNEYCNSQSNPSTSNIFFPYE